MSWGWELFWFMVILKIPVVYLAAVVWYAVRAQPLPPEPVVVGVREPALEPQPDHRLRPRPRLRPQRPHGGPSRARARRAEVAGRR